MFTLSIVLNLHREGELAKRTIQNLRDIIGEPSDWEKVEIVVILDNPDETTLNAVDNNSDLFSTVENVNYKNSSESRNHGVNVAENEFIVFADGDDYCSLNMLQILYTKFYAHYSVYNKTLLENLKDQEHIVLFPEYLIEFPKLFQMHYCDSNSFIIQNSRFTHSYHIKIAASKNLLEKNKFHTAIKPYGYEDWDLNNRLLNKGIPYKVVPYTLYYRKGFNQSVLSIHNAQKSIVKNSVIYSLDHCDVEILEGIEVAYSNPNFVLNTLKSNVLRQSYKEVLFEEDKVFLDNYGESYSYREDVIQSSTLDQSQKLSKQSLIYNSLMEFLEPLEMVYFVPWIKLGGADKVILEYTKSISNKYNAGLITTLNPGSRISKLKIPHFDLPSTSEHWNSLSEEDKMHIITKALVNSNIKIMHVINSNIALQTIKYYHTVYQEYNIKTIVSLFCPDYDWVNNAYHGYPVMYPELFNGTDMILSDNNYWYDFFKELNNNEDFKYKKIASTTNIRELTHNPKRKLSKKILWASRICNQKLFDVFEDIVNQLPEYEFVIYGGKPEEVDNIAILERLLLKPNIEFRGEYQDIEELDLNEFDLYLFTSLFEGIPTIILDMAMSGLPIVTAKVGGIAEVLGESYPLLVKEQRSAKAYIEKIKVFYANKEAIIFSMKETRNYIIKHHNEKKFQSDYNSVIKGLLNDNR